MDNNEFSFRALFDCPEFEFYENRDFKKAYSELKHILDFEVKDEKYREKLDDTTIECIQAAHMNAFTQGFCFAVKSIKFLMKI
ncbi:MAG: hypothetical protein NC253_11040 [Ruminococcus sp.]|nr:hypothetical protein [Ruminococcus sp.]MCM1381227.1 hypothetical protein [Muribaculaceae bacterium]MCM1478809.1 hypothetical protein [Muribaculaceae bacterium]